MLPETNLRLRLGSGIRVKDSQTTWVIGDITETERSFVGK